MFFVLITILVKQHCSISLSTTKLFKFQNFTLKFIIDKSFLSSSQITNAEIINAVVNARICKKNSPDEIVVNCPFCCPSKKVVEIRSSSKDSVGPFEVNDKMEFVFDKCKTNCSTSRDHLHSDLFFVIDSLPNIKVTSLPFTLRARLHSFIFIYLLFFLFFSFLFILCYR